MTWARGCGHAGWVSPFGGRAKLGWNLEWAAQWSLFGVTIEPCGKDLSTAGGSRDRSDAIAREVFEREPPLNVPYEFLNIGGRKMSTSKGRGAAAHEIAEVVPPEQLRLLFLRPRPQTAIEFDPDRHRRDPAPVRRVRPAGRRHRRAARSGRAAERPRERLPLLAPRPGRRRGGRAPQRSGPHSATSPCCVQIPGVDVEARVEAEKGAPLTALEEATLVERTAAADAWLATYAPDKARITVRRDGLPGEAAALEADQRAWLGNLAGAAGGGGAPASGDGWQALIFSTAADLGLAPGRAFAALYLAFLGRPNGPRAGWLLASLDQGFVEDRLRAAAGMPVGQAAR